MGRGIFIVNEVTIEKLVYGGDGLARIDGRVMLTPFVLPGEVVRVESRPANADLLRGVLKDVISPAAGRVNAPCPYFGRCGGCHYQHVSYEYQLEQKSAVLREVLRRVGKIEYTGEIHTVSAEPWQYRNRAQFHILDGRIGYLEAGSHRLCPIDRCPISSPKINETLAILLSMIGDRRWPRFLQSIELFTNETDVQINVLESGRPVARHFFDWCAEKIPGVVGGPLEYGRFRVSHASFFQVNRFLVDRLVDVALGEATGDSAVDLYAGVGLFSLALAGKYGNVAAVEPRDSAFRDLEFNIARESVGVKAQKATAEHFLSSLEEPPDFVLADPPRSGMGKQVVDQFLRLMPQRLALVACDPTTLARDLARLLPAYRIERLTMMDLFPQTYHFETIVHLARTVT